VDGFLLSQGVGSFLARVEFGERDVGEAQRCVVDAPYSMVQKEERA